MLEQGKEIVCSHCSEKISVMDKAPNTYDNCLSCGTTYEVPLFIQHFRVESIIRDDGVFVEYQAFDTRLNRNVLLKRLNKVYDQAEAEPVFPFLDCTGAVNIFSTFTHDDELYFIFEALNGYSIKSYLKRRENIDLKKGVHLAMEICKIMSDVAAEGINHGHLVPESIWVNNDGEVLIKDFMLRQNIINKNDPASRVSEILDVRYCSKQRLQTLEVNERCDLHSFGTFLYRILTGTYLYRSTDVDDLFEEQSLGTDHLSALAELNPAIRSLIIELVKEDGSFTTFSQVLEYFQTNFVAKKSKSPSSKSSKKSRDFSVKGSASKAKKKPSVKLPGKGKVAVKGSKRSLKKLFR